MIGFTWLALTLLASPCLSKTVEHWFNVTWVMANPDGLYERKVIGINNTWPLPVIEVDKGDRLVVHAHNGLGDKDTSIHFHGMFQNGTTDMDGASMISQCPIPPGSTFTYDFTVNQNGTYWYHCHVDFCYPDGYRQALIVHDQNSYFYHDYADEFVVTLSDWYHDLVEDIAPNFISLYNPTGAEPIPDSFLFNDTLNSSLPVQPNTTYLFRIINIGAFVGQYFYIEDHSLRIVEVDGVYVDAAEADTIFVAVAQRYSVLVTTKSTTDKNYAIVTVADQTTLDTVPEHLKLNNTNWLEYDKAAPHEEAVVTLDVTDSLPAFDDIALVPHDRQELLGEPNQRIELAVVMAELENGLPYALLNNISYTAPKVPVLYTVLSAGDQAVNSQVYGDTNAFVLNHNDVIEVVLNNNDTGSHPFHLHGHNFQVITRAPSHENFFSYKSLAAPIPYNPNNHSAFPTYPVRRDTILLPPQGYLVFRFVADNPGVWIFHCHIDWHLAQGLASVFIEAPRQIQEKLTIPDDHYAACRAGDVPYTGNAAGNTEDFLDLSGAPSQPGVIPYGGFTAKGIVAMVFAVLSAVLGIASLTVYGLSDIKYAANKKRQIYLTTEPKYRDDPEPENVTVPPKIN
ncbi:ferroxidase fet3 [Rhinocladiella similis]